MGSGRSRSSSGPIAPPVLRCCHGAGWSSEPLLGSTATAAWPRTLRPQSAAAKPGSIWLRSNCLRGGSPELQLIELLRRSRTTFPIPSQALNRVCRVFVGGKDNQLYQNGDLVQSVTRQQQKRPL